MNKLLLLGLLLSALFVSTADAQSLLITMVNQDPDPVRAGEMVEVRFKIENLWETTEDDLTFEIIPEHPFSLYSGEISKLIGRPIGRADPKEAIIVDFKLFVAPDSVDGDHNIDVKLTRGNTVWLYEDEFYIDVENEEINLKPYVRSSDMIISGTKGAITLELANAGESDIKFLELELLSSDDYKLLSTSNYVYLGDLDSDDTESEDFDIYVDKDTTKVDVPIKVWYQVHDTNYEDEFNLHLELLTEEEAKKVGLITTSYTLPILVSIAVVLVVLYLFKRYRKKKR